MPWKPLPLSYAVAIYPFQPSASPTELPLQIGDQLYVIEQGGKDGAWCRGYLVAPPTLLSALTPGGRTAADARVFSGIFPKCCIEIREQLGPEVSVAVRPGEPKPQAPVPMLKIGDDSPTSSTEPLVDEISSCLREWYILHLPDLVLRREYHVLDQMSEIISRLDYARRELLNDVLTAQERLQVRNDAVWDLVRGNKMLSGEVIVRDATQQGRLLTSEDSAIEMTKLQAIMSVLDSPPSEKSRATSLHHCLVEVISVVGSDLESASLNLALYRNDSDGSPVSFSETYSSVASAKMKTLFSDLSTRDIGDAGETFLTVKVTISEPPRKAKRRAPERPPSRNGTLLGQRQLSLNRRRSSLMFGKRKHAERPHPGVNGRATPQTNERAQTPSIAEEEDGSSPAQGPPVPRTIAVGILDVNKIMRDNKSVEETITMWSVSARDDEKTREVDPRIKQLLNSQGRSLVVSPYISSVALRLTPYTAPDADTMIKNNPTSMHLVTKSQKIGFSEAPSKPRSDIYLRLSKAVITQGAHLSHPELNVAPIKAQSMQNLQLTMEVRDSSGRRIEHCIYPSANGAAVTALRTNAVEIDSAWDQTLCLRVPTEKVPDSHLILSIADAPEFPFALAWMPLWDKKAFISDGNHSLILHAYDKITSSVVQGRGAYLSLPWNNATYKTVHEGSYANIASLEVNTLLCSTEYSQDRTLVSLINWKHQTSVQLLDILQKLTFVQEIEIVKQLQDVLDALFGVLVHKSGESKFEDLIFNDIVWVLGIVHDRRYNLGPLVEQYTESHFRSPYAASCLIRSFTRLLQSVSDPQSARDMRALFKVGRTFMKIVITSYQQRRFGSQTNENRDEKHSTFKQDMQAILFGLQMMMRSETAALVGSKTLLVREFHTWLPELLPAFSKEEVIRTSIDFIDSCEDATGKLILYRLILIHNYTKLDQIWVDDRDKKMLVKNCVRWLSPYWTQNDLSDDWHEQVRLSCSIVAELTRIPTHYLHEFMPKLISAYEVIARQPSVRRRSLSFLFPDSYPFVNRATDSEDSFDEALLELSATVATIARMKAPSVPKIQGQELSEYVLSTLTMLRSLLQHNACPSTWLSLHIYHHSCALTILNYLSTLLISLYLPSPEEAENPDQADSFNLKMSLWKSFLDTLLMLVSSAALALELFPEQKRRAVWKISGDVRQTGADLLRNCWESLGWEATADDQRRYNIRRLGGYQVQYVPSLVAPTIRLCLSMHEGLRKVAVEILQAMIINEWALSDGESLELIETEVIGALNSIIKAKPVSANEAMSRKIFIAELLELFSTIANQPDDALWTAIEDLVATIDELVDLLTTTEADEEVDGEPRDPSNGHARGQSGDSQNSEAKELARARRSIDGLTPTSPALGREKEYGVHALECYKQLAEEYERNGDYKRLAKTYRAIARIHEARAASRAGAGGLMNGRRAYGEQNADGEEEDDD